ncbi:MAG: hypothetical protein HOP07_15775 [Bacteriovoracaceae bacterium]|nr:hypothetical protein [Bacteriovoracaceae bacterium]
MKKIQKNIGVFLLSIILIGAIFYYLKFLEKDYDSLMKRAYKRKEEFITLSVFDGFHEVSIPDAEKNSIGLGVDSDSNGIRDDIDIWINRMSNNFNERMAMRQYAKVQFGLMRDCLENKNSNQVSANDALKKSQICLEMISYYERNGKSFGVPMLNLLLPNTDFRKSCYQFKNISGFNKVVTVDLLKSNCQFEVQNSQGIVEVSEIYKNSIH